MKYKKLTLKDVTSAIDSELNYMWFNKMLGCYYATRSKGSQAYHEVAVLVCGEHILDDDYTWSSINDPISLDKARKGENVE